MVVPGIFLLVIGFVCAAIAYFSHAARKRVGLAVDGGADSGWKREIVGSGVVRGPKAWKGDPKTGVG